MFVRILLVVALVGCTVAVPSPGTSKYATHRVRRLVNGAEVTNFSPPSQFETFGTGIDHPLAKRAEPADTKDASLSFVSLRLGMSEADISFKSSFTGGSVKHVYFKQKINGVEVANAVANVALNSEDKVVTFGANFINPERISSTEPQISADEAIATAEQQYNAAYNGFPTGLEFFAKDDGTAVLMYVVQVQNDYRWLEVFVDAETGEVVAANDFTAQSAFLAVPINRQALNDGQRLLENPEDRTSSPDGWNTNSTGTSGNNVLVCKNPTGSCTLADITEQSAPGLVFNCPADDSLNPTVASNVDAARTNAFYISNSIHDITYRYGFTESAFNFQNDNLDKGGAGNGGIEVYVQDGGVNNALFFCPPDGQGGIMKLYVFNLTTPNRDGALQNDIIAHEYTHGLTGRLTGGGSARCLQSIESAGLGEGWSDAFAEWTEQTPEIGDWVTGSYVTNNPGGPRTYPYSTNKTVNPLMYGDLQDLNEVHDIGEVWVTVLHDVLAALVGAHGFSSKAFTNPDGTEGNVVYMHLFIDQLSIQPCTPTFVQARDAWIQADVNRYNGANGCLLWNAFAGRGFGVNAANYTNDDTVPDGC